MFEFLCAVLILMIVLCGICFFGKCLYGYLEDLIFNIKCYFNRRK